MLNISMNIIAISNCLKLPWHLSIDTVLTLIRQKAKPCTLMVSSVNGILITLLTCVYRHEQINIYSEISETDNRVSHGSVQHYIFGDFREMEEKDHKIKDVYKR